MPFGSTRFPIDCDLCRERTWAGKMSSVSQAQVDTYSSVAWTGTQSTTLQWWPRTSRASRSLVHSTSAHPLSPLPPQVSSSCISIFFLLLSIHPSVNPSRSDAYWHNINGWLRTVITPSTWMQWEVAFFHSFFGHLHYDACWVMASNCSSVSLIIGHILLRKKQYTSAENVFFLLWEFFKLKRGIRPFLQSLSGVLSLLTLLIMSRSSGTIVLVWVTVPIAQFGHSIISHQPRRGSRSVDPCSALRPGYYWESFLCQIGVSKHHKVSSVWWAQPGQTSGGHSWIRLTHFNLMSIW